ncbi:hypothetical protein NEISICOT_02310 [Neisseria sicca ATCC 29256]|uniref:Uncharacterized protein n=1 Tax=Neisseria sicca ATCC 29256 TaxID=547045 RepID=C6M707_NEISI|nr:hypothetical protein NEISICOT_02310 [Neisseria sicca ATCC 29256]
MPIQYFQAVFVSLLMGFQPILHAKYSNLIKLSFKTTGFNWLCYFFVGVSPTYRIRSSETV